MCPSGGNLSGHAPAHILLMADGLKVSGINAKGVATKVVNLKAVGYRSLKKFM